MSDKASMKRGLTLLHFMIVSMLLVLASCGSDNSTGTKAASNQSALSGECSCNSENMPVCGMAPNGNYLDYMNSCHASCNKATNVVGGHCICQESTLVCGVDGRDYTECEAHAYRVKIKKYSPCRSSEL